MEEKQQKPDVDTLTKMIDEMLIRHGLAPTEKVQKTGNFIYIPHKMSDESAE